MHFNKTILLTSYVILGSLVSSITSCNSATESITVPPYTLVKEDSVTLSTLVEQMRPLIKNIKTDDPSAFEMSVDNKNIIKTFPNGKIVAKDLGETTLTISDKETKKELFTVPFKVEKPITLADHSSFLHSKANFGDTLGDIIVGNGNYAKGSKNKISLSNSQVSDKSLQISSSNNDIIQPLEEDGKYYLLAQNVGEARIEIFDSHNDLMFSYVIKVVSKLESDEEVRDFLTTVDYFKAMGWENGSIDAPVDKVMKLSFPTTQSGILYGFSGEMGIDIGKNTFDIDYVQYGITGSGESSMGYDSTFRYEILNFSPQVQFEYSLKYLDISDTKDQIRLYTTNILLDFFFPASNK